MVILLFVLTFNFKEIPKAKMTVEQLMACESMETIVNLVIYSISIVEIPKQTATKNLKYHKVTYYTSNFTFHECQNMEEERKIT